MILVVGGCAMHCRVFSSISDLYHLDAHSNLHSQLGKSKMSPDIVQCPQGAKNQHQLRTADLENKGLSSPTVYHTDEETKAQKH